MRAFARNAHGARVGALIIVATLTLGRFGGAPPPLLAAGPAALNFNGTSSAVSVPDSATLRIVTNLTAEAWIKPSVVTTRSQFFGKGTWELSLEPVSGGFRTLFEFSTAFGNWHSIASGSYAFGQWYHVAATYDGTNARLFVNGALVAAAVVGGNIDPSTSGLRLGSVEFYSDYYKGLIDEARASDIVRYTAAFTALRAPFLPDANTRGLWHLDEGSGTATADASGGAHNGSLSGSTTWTTDTPFSGTLDTVPPVISGVGSGAITNASATISWSTDEPATSQVEYGTTTGYGSATTLNASLLTSHVTIVSGLSPGTVYNYRVVSRDAAGNTAASANFAFATTVNLPSPPVISAVTSSSVTQTAAVISWTTDVVSDSQVEYGTTLSYGTTTPLDSSLVTSHARPLSGLSAGQIYHYRVGSRGQNGVLATSADATFATPAPNASSQGQWSAVQNWPLVAVHASLLPSGDVVMWDAWETPGTPSGRVWNPTTQLFTSVPVPHSALFCAAHTYLMDGRPFVIGGHNGGDVGIPDTNVFDSATNSWVSLAPMHYSRWYPTAVALNDGRLLALGGEITPGVFADVPEVYDPATNIWTLWPGATQALGEYPAAFTTPNGKVFVVAGPDLKSRTLDVSTPGWTVLGTAPPVPTGTSAMYRPGRIIATGGGTGNTDPIQRGTALIDLNQPTPSWRQTSVMAYPRVQHNLVLLPDGKVLAVGGSTQMSLLSTVGTLPAEMWDPATESWTTMASMHDLRMYHSIALLLRDGRVLVAGGGRISPANDYLTAEIYSPPYLFKGPRPTITNAPGTTTYGGTMTVQTPDAADVVSASLIRMPSVTHTYEMSARFVNLTFTPRTGGLDLQSPANANVAPPGYYMLFLVNSAGVPSVASVVRLGGAPPVDTQPPTVSFTTPTNGANLFGSITLDAVAVDNVAVTSVQFMVDGSPLGAPITTAPYQATWNTLGSANGAHILTANAVDAAGNAAATAVTVNVTNAPNLPTVVASVAPAAIIQGASATLSWNASAATSVAIDQNIGPVPASGSLTVTPSSTTTYTVTATNSSGSATAAAVLTVNSPPPLPTASLTASPSIVNLGGASMLSWSTTDAPTVTISGGVGAVGATGARSVSPLATTTYTLTASNTTGVATATATVTVNVPPPTATLTVSPATITAGTSATLSWSSANATLVTIDHGIGTVIATGSLTISPAATTTYVMTATNSAGTASANAAITVNPAPPPLPGASLKFNGSNSRARFTVLPALTVFTVEAWVKRTTDTGRYETFVSNAAAGYAKETFGLYVDGGNADCGSSPPDQFAWAYTKTTGGWFAQCSGVSANLNAWHHIAVTRDSTNATRIFIDGVLKNTMTGTAPPSTSTGFLGVGSAGDALTEYFAGLVDEVRISTVARYSVSFTPQTANFTSDTSTVALYHFDEGTGQVLSDSSGNNRNGTLGASSAVETADPQWSTDAAVR